MKTLVYAFVSISLQGHMVLESWQGVLAVGLQTLQTLASMPTLVISVIIYFSQLALKLQLFFDLVFQLDLSQNQRLHSKQPLDRKGCLKLILLDGIDHQSSCVQDIVLSRELVFPQTRRELGSLYLEVPYQSDLYSLGCSSRAFASTASCLVQYSTQAYQ